MTVMSMIMPREQRRRTTTAAAFILCCYLFISGCCANTHAQKLEVGREEEETAVASNRIIHAVPEQLDLHEFHEPNGDIMIVAAAVTSGDDDDEESDKDEDDETRRQQEEEIVVVRRSGKKEREEKFRTLRKARQQRLEEQGFEILSKDSDEVIGLQAVSKFQHREKQQRSNNISVAHDRPRSMIGLKRTPIPLPEDFPIYYEPQGLELLDEGEDEGASSEIFVLREGLKTLRHAGGGNSNELTAVLDWDFKQTFRQYHLCDRSCCMNVEVCKSGDSESLDDYNKCIKSIDRSCYIEVEWMWNFEGPNWWDDLPLVPTITRGTVRLFNGMEMFKARNAFPIQDINMVNIIGCEFHQIFFLDTQRIADPPSLETNDYFKNNMLFWGDRVQDIRPGGGLRIKAFVFNPDSRIIAAVHTKHHNGAELTYLHEGCPASYSSLTFSTTVLDRTYGTKPNNSGINPPPDYSDDTDSHKIAYSKYYLQVHTILLLLTFLTRF